MIRRWFRDWLYADDDEQPRESVRAAVARIFWRPLLLAPRNLSELVNLYAEQTRMWAELAARRPEPRRHFVALLVVAEGRGVGGSTLELVDGDGPKMIEFRCESPKPLGPGLVLAFCDLAAVQVDNFFQGTDLLALNLGAGAPLATFERVEPGVMLRAAVRLRGKA